MVQAISIQEEPPAPDDASSFVETVNPESRYPALLVCDHAGRRVPADLGDLGLGREAMSTHIAWDIGAGPLTVGIAERLGATAVLQHCSRLVIDCNRPPGVAESIPAISHGKIVPGNRDLPQAEAMRRRQLYFDPFDTTVRHLLAQRSAAFAIHSFTPRMDGVDRLWDLGLLFRHDTDTSRRLGAALLRARPDLMIGYNQPYQIDDSSDWFVPRHGEALGVAHSLIEVRNDHLGSVAGIDLWADLLAEVIGAVTGDMP